METTLPSEAPPPPNPNPNPPRSPPPPTSFPKKKRTFLNNSKRFLKLMPLMSILLNQNCVGFDGMRSINVASRQVLFE